jgi:thiamine biosynthesis protein ThiS
MRLTVNGEEREYPEGTTVAGLVAALGLGTTKVAVEVNRRVIPVAAHGGTPLATGDRVEVVQFVGGG